MERINYIILCVFILGFASCNEPMKEVPMGGISTSVKKEKKVMVVENKIKESDTLNISVGYPQILAFSMSQKDYDKLSELEAGEYDERYADLKYYLGKFAETEKGRDVLIKETASGCIRIGDSVIDRHTLNTSLGLIFITKNGHFEIVFDGLLDSEITQKANSMSPPLIP